MCLRRVLISGKSPRIEGIYRVAKEGQRKVMRILRSFLSATFYNLIFRLTGLYMYELMKRYNRWLVITAAGPHRWPQPRFSSCRRSNADTVWTKFYSRHDRSFRSTSFCNYYGFYDSPEKKLRPLILCPCGRALIKCRRLRPALVSVRFSVTVKIKRSFSLRHEAAKKS